MTPASYALAFNQGSDARLRGASYYDCPFTGLDTHRQRHYWQMGWLDVDRWWGWWNRAAEPLPKVYENHRDEALRQAKTDRAREDIDSDDP
jgi:hypothetical protein